VQDIFDPELVSRFNEIVCEFTIIIAPYCGCNVFQGHILGLCAHVLTPPQGQVLEKVTPSWYYYLLLTVYTTFIGDILINYN
jgi:hypothetical protein